MRTGLTKKQKTTVIYFDEHSRIIEVQTHNTDLKKRLTAFAAKQHCFISASAEIHRAALQTVRIQVPMLNCLQK